MIFTSFFFFIVNFFFFYYFNFYTFNVSFIILYLITLYFIEISDFFFSNCHLCYLNSNLIHFNFFLLNNINKYHPFIFYISVVLMFIIFFFLVFSFINDFYYFRREHFTIYFFNIFYSIFYFNFLALFRKLMSVTGRFVRWLMKLRRCGNIRTFCSINSYFFYT